MELVCKTNIQPGKIMSNDESSASRLLFPQKLWHLMNTRSDAIQWGNNGHTILLNYNILDNYLRCNQSIFKTNHISSFIRQLNLYGFRKVTSHMQDPLCNSSNPYLHEYIHDCFQQGKPDLLPIIKRKSWNVNKAHIFQLPYVEVSGCYKSRVVLEARKALKNALKKAAHQWINDKSDIHASSSEDEMEQETTNTSEQTNLCEVIEDRYYEEAEEQHTSYQMNGETFEVYQEEYVCGDTYIPESETCVDDSQQYGGNIIIEVLDETECDTSGEEIYSVNQFVENTENDGSQFLVKAVESTYESCTVEDACVDESEEKYDFERACIENSVMNNHEEVGSPWEYSETILGGVGRIIEAHQLQNEIHTTNEWKELYSQITNTMDLLQS